MSIDRSVNSSSTNEVPASIEEFAAKAYSKESQSRILIADGSMNQLDGYFSGQGKEATPSSRPEQKAPPREIPQPLLPADIQPQTPAAGCYQPQPALIYSGDSYYYPTGTMHCRRPYVPVQPVYGHPVDRRKVYRYVPNPLVKPALDFLVQMDGQLILDKYPSEVSRQDPSACFLNQVLQQIIHRQTSGNTVEQIAVNLDNLKHPTNHFVHYSLEQEIPGDIIIAYPKDGSRPEAAVYMGNGNVAAFNPDTKRVTTHDGIRYFYPDKDPNKTFFGKVVLYRWKRLNEGY